MTITKSAMTAVGAVIATLVLVLGAVFLPFTPASSTPGNGGGNNGTLKVLDQNSPVEHPDNEPKVCNPRFEGFGFDAEQALNLISEPAALNINVVADGEGYFVTGTNAMPAGKYKVTAYGKSTPDGPTEDKAKSKVFKVECEPVTPVQDEEEVEVYGPGDCATLTQTVTTTTYTTIDGVRQEPPVSVVTSTVPWTPVGDECETEEPPVTPTPTPEVPVTTPEVPVTTPEVPTETPTPDKDKDEPVRNTPNQPQPPKDVQVIACVNGTWVTTVNGEVISESGTCAETSENSEFQTFTETGL